MKVTSYKLQITIIKEPKRQSVKDSDTLMPGRSDAKAILHLDKKGFTLIETIVVMVIIVILAAVVVVRNPFNDIKIYSATRKVSGDLRYAQQLAISTQTKCGIYFTSSTAYRIFENNNTSDPAKAAGDSCSDNSGNFETDFSAGRCSNYSGVTFSATPIIYFNSIGTPVNSSGFAIIGNQTIILSLGGASSQSITIEGGTGRVSY